MYCDCCNGGPAGMALHYFDASQCETEPDCQIIDGADWVGMWLSVEGTDADWQAFENDPDAFIADGIATGKFATE